MSVFCSKNCKKCRLGVDNGPGLRYNNRRRREQHPGTPHGVCGRSSSGRAPPCQGGGSEFEPRRPLHYCGSLAQLGEHLPYKQRVSGSSPLTSTKQEKSEPSYSSKRCVRIFHFYQLNIMRKGENCGSRLFVIYQTFYFVVSIQRIPSALLRRRKTLEFREAVIVPARQSHVGECRCRNPRCDSFKSSPNRQMTRRTNILERQRRYCR